MDFPTARDLFVLLHRACRCQGSDALSRSCPDDRPYWLTVSIMGCCAVVACISRNRTFATAAICDLQSSTPWHQAQLSVGNPSPRAANVIWVTDRTNLGRPQLHLDDERQDAASYRPAWLACLSGGESDRSLP